MLRGLGVGGGRSGAAGPPTGAVGAWRRSSSTWPGLLRVAVVRFPRVSNATDVEALLVRVPWPAWLAELEATRYDNPNFVPVELVDHTAGYDSECAVLFPETVSVAPAGTEITA